MNRHARGNVPVPPSGAKGALVAAGAMLLLFAFGALAPAVGAVPNATSYTLQGLSLAHTCNPSCADLSTGTSFGWAEGDWWPAQLTIDAGTSGASCVAAACTIGVNLDYRTLAHSSGDYVYAIDAFAACGPIYPSGSVSASGQCGSTIPPPLSGATPTTTAQYASGTNGPGTLYDVLVCDSSFSCSTVAASHATGSLGSTWIIPSSHFFSPYIGEADQAIAFTVTVGPFAAGSVHYIEWANHLAVTGVCTYQGNCGTASLDTDTSHAGSTLGASNWPGGRIHMSSDMSGIVNGVRDVPVFVDPPPTGVPEFSLGMVWVVAAALPLLYALRLKSRRY